MKIRSAQGHGDDCIRLGVLKVGKQGSREELRINGFLGLFLFYCIGVDPSHSHLLWESRGLAATPIMAHNVDTPTSNITIYMYIYSMKDVKNVNLKSLFSLPKSKSWGRKQHQKLT